MLQAFILAFVVTAALADIWWRKIPNGLTVFGLIAGLSFHLVRGGFLSSLTASVIGFAVGITFFHLGAIGGGDVKLITALGALLGTRDWLLAMELAILVAGLVALLQVVRRRALRQTLHNMIEIARGLGSRGLQRHPEIHIGNPMTFRAPFGFAAAIGTVIALVQR
jgi:prepilin peptidase CpaA